MIWLCPAVIREDTIKACAAIAETIHMYLLTELLVQIPLRKLDADPDTLRLQFGVSFRDPPMERVGRLAPPGGMLVEALAADWGFEF
ncbi:MAG: hypothetical protein OXM58_21005 [Rhodospirillaceae bacterium]|nr:hypothetical protein [Rhodospirillaceae bacterium]MDE0616133.1 hypothetical protein [Rhodospirillaceae bacterium]